MEIKGFSSSSVIQSTRSFLSKKNGFFKAMIAIMGIMACGIVFLGAVSYGAFLQKRGQTPNLKNFLIAVSELDFAFIPNYGVGMAADIDQFDVEIKFKHMLRIQYLREQAFSKGIIDDVQDLYDNGITTSTEELAKTPANIQFQPNPMADQAELIFNDLENSIQQVSIYSIDGKLMQVYDSVFGKSLTIERNELGQGMYFYKILTDDFQVHSGKFIVQ